MVWFLDWTHHLPLATYSLTVGYGGNECGCLGCIISIIVMTLIIKVATFPLTKTQLESTNKMQVRKRILILVLHGHWPI